MLNVSIVMPAYNAANYIGKTIESIQHQSHTSWELIVVDDCSSDNTVDLVKKASEEDFRIRLVPLDANYGGPAGPRNIGVKESRYDLISFCDSDDIWHPLKLEKQLALIDNKESFFSCTEILNFHDNDQISFNKKPSMKVVEVDYLSQSLRSKIPTSSVMLSKKIALDFPFEEDSSYKAVEDYHCWLRILKSGVFCKKIKDPLVFYRICAGQISGSKMKMVNKVFMVHRNFPDRNVLSAFIFTVSHVVGGVYFRFFRGVM